MTWSVVARDPASGHLGVAVATCAFAVGARVPFVRTGIGAVATQAFTNPFYGPRGLDLLASGLAPDDVVSRLTDADAGRGDRQVHLVDRDGRSAAYTGRDCVPWCGHLVRSAFSVAGNMLAGADVIAATADSFEAGATLPLARRLLAALKAGEAKGGDRRGRQSAAILVHDDEDYALVDVRVDDASDPLTEIGRLLDVNDARFSHYRRFMPSRANPAGIVGREELERRIAASIAEA